MTLKEIVNNMLTEVRSVSKNAQKHLSIQENLKIRHANGHVRYYQSSTAGDRYLAKDCEDTIRKLEEKHYYSELLKAAEEEEAGLLKIQKILETMPDYKSVFLSITPEKRHLIQPYEHTPERPVESVHVFNKKPVPEKLQLITQNGERVRSKSELIIADRLKTAGVPYFYEEPLLTEKGFQMASLFWHPDFRVQNVRTGKQYYWEHFGMLDKPGYCDSCQTKLEVYAQNGYFPGENLIISSESSDHGLNTKYIDCLIDRYLQ